MSMEQDNEEINLIELRKKKSHGNTIKIPNKARNNVSNQYLTTPTAVHTLDDDRQSFAVHDNATKESVLSFFKSEGHEGVGQLYFRGLVRFTQFKYLRFVTIIEIIGSIVTLLHASVFYYAENELISKETFMIEFEIGYFIFCNLLPMFIMIR